MIFDLKCNCYRKPWLIISATWFKAFAFLPCAHRYQHVTDSPVSLPLLFSGWNQSLWQMWRILWKVYSSHDYWSPNSSSVNIQKKSVSQRGDILWNLQIAGACFFIPSWDLCLKYLCLFSRMLMRSQSLLNFSRPLK